MGEFIINANIISFPHFISRGTQPEQEATVEMEELDPDASGSG